MNLLKKSEIPQDAELYGKFESQLQEIVIRGHRIELHLHPHWLDVRKENNEWVFQSYKHYKLNSLTEEKIIELFQEGVEASESYCTESCSRLCSLCLSCRGMVC